MRSACSMLFIVARALLRAASALVPTQPFRPQSPCVARSGDAARKSACATVIALILAGAAILLPQATQLPRPLADWIPASPLLYIEAKDLASLVKQWNSSNEKTTWLASDNYQVFSRSRLFLRFSEAQQEFATAAGFAPDMSLVDAAAGTNSALALYDIGTLEFLYITRMPAAGAYQSLLWQSRAKFQPRQSGGIDYYVRQQQRRIAAFAVTNDLLLIATGEQALASALQLIAGQSPPAMKQEPWYQRATAAQPTPGELRMVLNFDRVAKTPYFRSYWVQRNTRDLMQFNAVISDLDYSPTGYRERRALLRAEPAVDLRSSEAAVGEISRFAPTDAGLFRAWAKPETAAVLALIEQKLIAPRQENPEERYRRAPSAGNVDETVGSEEDLETRIDEPPLVDDSQRIELQPLRKLLEANPIQAMLQVEKSQASSDGVFVTTPRAIALLGASQWDPAAASSALRFEPFSGVDRIWVHAVGRVLIVASSEDLSAAMAGRAPAAAPMQGAQYVMRLFEARELPSFQRMMTLIDYPSLRASGEAREPLFFSENIASLGRTLARIDSVFLESHDDGNIVTQNVTYKLQ
jgi:hypothetical protein